MFRTINDFVVIWSRELEATQKILKHIPDRALSQAVDPEGRTLGRLAWHITTTITEMMSRTGLQFTGVDPEAPVPGVARDIARTYTESAVALLEAVQKSWNDATLTQTDSMYGEKWARGDTLASLVHHQIHHRAQMTVLMRQAGLEVPGIYGPARQEWAAFGMKPPAV